MEGWKIERLEGCNVVYATKETLTICYLDLYCIKMDNISKIAELSVVMNAGLVELLVASVPQTRLTSARLTVALPGWYATTDQGATLNGREKFQLNHCK